MSVTLHLIGTEQHFWYKNFLAKNLFCRVNKLFILALSFFSLSVALKAFKLEWNYNLIISFLSFYYLFKQMKKRKSKYNSSQLMTLAGMFRGSLAAGELFCSVVICFRTTLPAALMVLAGFGSCWNFLVSSCFVIYSCNLNMSSVTTRTTENRCYVYTLSLGGYKDTLGRWGWISQALTESGQGLWVCECLPLLPS